MDTNVGERIKLDFSYFSDDDEVSVKERKPNKDSVATVQSNVDKPMCVTNERNKVFFISIYDSRELRCSSIISMCKCCSAWNC